MVCVSRHGGATTNSQATMTDITHSRLLAALIAGVFLLSACGGDDDTGDAGDGAPVSSDAADDPPDSDPEPDDSPDPEGDGTETPPTDEGTTSPGAGVFLADFCAGGQPLNGAISLDDLVSFGLLTSTNATVEGSAAYGASAYETFGFLCNISEEVGDGENFLTIGLSAGSDNWDLAVEQGDVPVEQMGDWEVLIGTNWLSPLTMRTTDSAGNQDSLFAVWTTADGSIPVAATLERVMRPLAEAIAARSTVDIPRS